MCQWSLRLPSVVNMDDDLGACLLRVKLSGMRFEREAGQAMTLRRIQGPCFAILEKLPPPWQWAKAHLHGPSQSQPSPQPLPPAVPKQQDVQSGPEHPRVKLALVETFAMSKRYPRADTALLFLATATLILARSRASTLGMHP